MNIWDSVQRGLEKATQEATRIARTQRLRSTIDGLTRQIHSQEEDLLARTMEVFAAGHLIQGELLPICQELTRLQQQLEQNRQELAQLQNQGTQSTTAGQATPSVPGSYTPASDLSPTV
jgi:chromosome segregation ATPase